MESPLTYDVVLSYNSRDKAAVRFVYERLTQAGLTCFLDAVASQAGDRILNPLREGGGALVWSGRSRTARINLSAAPTRNEVVCGKW